MCVHLLEMNDVQACYVIVIMIKQQRELLRLNILICVFYWAIARFATLAFSFPDYL